MSSPEHTEKQEFSLEKSLAEIRSIVEKMQKGVSDFDQQMALFAKGNELIEQCQEYLDQAELKIKQLVDGQTEDADFDI